MKKMIYLVGGMTIMSLFACTTQKGVKTADQVTFPEFSSEAHRGGRGLMPENTIIAMRDAIDRGVTTLEMDALITADQQVVITHDPYLNGNYILKPDGSEITKAEQKDLIVYKIKYEDLRKYDVGSKFNTAFPQQKKVKTSIPKLADLIDSVQTYITKNNKKQVFYNIETKSVAKDDNVHQPEPAVFVKLLMDVLQQKKIMPYVVIQSFDKRTIQLIHKNYPQVRTSYLVSNKKSFEDNIAELGYKPFIYSPAFKMVTPELVSKCHAQQIKIIPWTANTRADIENLKRMKVDGIITDYPNLLVD